MRVKKKGILYLLKANFNGVFIYKYGVTQKSSTAARLKYISRIYKVPFMEISSFICQDIYKSENLFSWKLRCFYTMEKYDFEWGDYPEIYQKSSEVIASDKDISEILKSIMLGVIV